MVEMKSNSKRLQAEQGYRLQGKKKKKNKKLTFASSSLDSQSN